MNRRPPACKAGAPIQTELTPHRWRRRDSNSQQLACKASALPIGATPPQSGWADLNRRPPGPKPGALPLRYTPIMPPERLELPTPGLKAPCSTKLSYDGLVQWRRPESNWHALRATGFEAVVSTSSTTAPWRKRRDPNSETPKGHGLAGRCGASCTHASTASKVGVEPHTPNSGHKYLRLARLPFRHFDTGCRLRI